jgi:hypothetical protein
VADSHSDQEGVCDDNSVSTSYFDLNCFSETNDSTPLYNIINHTGNNYAIFWRGHDDNGNGQIDSTWNASGAEGEVYVHPILAVLKLKNITHVYDFSTGAGMDKWAFRWQVNAKPPNTCDVPSTEFTTAQYNNISADDGTFQSDFSESNYAAHRFNFSIDELAANISKINVTWNGIGWHDNGGADNGTYLYIWNSSSGASGAYEELANNSGDGNEVTLTGERTSSISSYINAGNVTVLVEQKTTGDGFSYSRLKTDYVRVVVTP